MEASKTEQTNVGFPPKFGAVKPALTAVLRVTKVLPKSGSPLGALTVIRTDLPLSDPT